MRWYMVLSHASLLLGVWFALVAALAKPQRDMRWLHCFVDGRYQMLAQLVEIDLITQCRAESSESLGSVIFAAVEAAVDERLDAPSQWLKESCNHQCGGDDDQGLLGQTAG